MDRTEERGWYVSDLTWTGRGEPVALGDQNRGGAAGSLGERKDNGLGTEAFDENMSVTADESRDRCAVCGINFRMFFDQDEGEWKYGNCQEVEALNDEAAEEESEMVLVHAKCLRGLGSPETLTADQVLRLH